MRTDSYLIDNSNVLVPESHAIGCALDRIAFASLCAFVCMMPWQELPLFEGFVVGKWIGLLTFGILVLRIAVTGHLRKVSLPHALMLGLVLWAGLSVLWTVDRDTTLTRTGTYAQLLVAVWTIWELAVTDARVTRLLDSYVFGTSLLSISTIANFVRGRDAADLWAEQGLTKWHEARYTVNGLNENDLGLILALSLPMTLYLLTRRKGAWAILLGWLQIGLCLTSIFLSGSRGALIAAMVGLSIFPLVMYRLPRRMRFALVLACAGGIACGAYLIPETTWRRILATGAEVSEGTMTHRTLLWEAGLEAFRDKPFKGVGAGAYGTAVLRSVGIPYVAHNTFISVLVELGVVGASLFFALLASLFYSASRMPYLERCLWTILLMTWAVGVFALTWEYYKPTWFLFGLLAAQAYPCGNRSVAHSDTTYVSLCTDYAGLIRERC
jgi:O-antigen ligase